MYGKLDQKPFATEFIDARGEVTTVVLLNAHSIKIFLNVCDYTHRLLLSSTEPEQFVLAVAGNSFRSLLSTLRHCES